MKEKIEFKEFLEIENKLEIMTGTITDIEEVTKSKKLIKLTVRFTDEDVRTVVTNIKPHITDISDFIMKEFLFVTNLKPVTMMGIESTAMILPGEIENGKLVGIKGDSGVKIL